MGQTVEIRNLNARIRPSFAACSLTQPSGDHLPPPNDPTCAPHPIKGEHADQSTCIHCCDRHRRSALVPPIGGCECGDAGRAVFNRKSSAERSAELLAPRAGFEPAALRLTAACSTVELPRITECDWDDVPKNCVVRNDANCAGFQFSTGPRETNAPISPAYFRH